ncbi:MAG: cation transporter [Novosphingobium sp.]
MSDCGCKPAPVETDAQRRVLLWALALNAAMFAIEVSAGMIAHSTGLIADGLDMLSDACVYAIAIAAIDRGTGFKANAAAFSGIMLLGLGLGLIADVLRRIYFGSTPEGFWMIAISIPALAVNVIVLRLLARQRSREVHMRAAWIFTRADVVANTAVVLSGMAVLTTGIRYFDLAVGAGIGAYVVREALEILGAARQEKTANRSA